MINNSYFSMLLLAISFSWVSNAGAEQQSILLNDGTQLIGEVISLKNGSYTVRTNTLGTLSVSDRQVRQISSLASGSANGAQLSGSDTNPVESAKNAMNGNQLQSIQQRMMGDSGMLQQIMALQSSPEMKAVLADPEVMAAIANLDFDALSNNPKIKRLMSNQDVRVISGKVN